MSTIRPIKNRLLRQTALTKLLTEMGPVPRSNFALMFYMQEQLGDDVVAPYISNYLKQDKRFQVISSRQASIEKPSAAETQIPTPAPASKPVEEEQSRFFSPISAATAILAALIAGFSHLSNHMDMDMAPEEPTTKSTDIPSKRTQSVYIVETVTITRKPLKAIKKPLDIPPPVITFTNKPSTSNITPKTAPVTQQVMPMPPQEAGHEETLGFLMQHADTLKSIGVGLVLGAIVSTALLLTGGLAAPVIAGAGFGVASLSGLLANNSVFSSGDDAPKAADNTGALVAHGIN